MRLTVLVAAVSLSIIGLASAGDVRASIRKPTNIPAQNLGAALQALAKDRNFQVVYVSEEVNSLRTHGAVGEFNSEEALKELLSGTGMTFRYLDEKTVTIVRVPSSSPSAGSAPAQPDTVPAGSTPGDSTKEGKEGSSDGFRVAQLDHGAPSNASTVTQANQHTSESGPAVLQEVLVTAQKRTERLLDVPISIAALSSEDIKEAHIQNFADLSLAIPGLAVVDSGTNYRQVFIRGIANGDPFADTPLVGTYLDEAAVSGFGGGALDLRTYDLARVEVLRGPQGTLYGEGSMGGTIRFITNDPKLDHFSGSGDVMLSFTEHGDPSQDIIAVVNAPLVDNILAIRVAGEFDHVGGWLDEPAANAKNINFQQLTDVRTKILWVPSDALKVAGLVNTHRNPAGAPNYVPGGPPYYGVAPHYGEDPNFIYNQTLGETTVPRIDDNFDLYNLTATYAFGSFAILNSASYERSLKQLYDVGNIVYINAPPPAPPGDLLFNWEYKSQQRSDELRATSTGSGPWHWTVGTYFRDGEFDIVGPYLLRFAPGPPVLNIIYVKEMSTKSWSLFGEMSYKLFDRLEIGTGIRYFTDKQGLYNGAALQEATFHSFDPRIYASFDLDTSARIYASAAKGFRSGGFNVDQTQPPFNPESVWTYELGAKERLLNGRIDAELAVYYSDYQDMQAVALPPPPALPVNYTFNAGTAHIKGVDFSFTVQATAAVSVGLKGAYTDAKYVKINALSADHVVGDPVDYAPRYNGSVWSKYDFRWRELPGFVRIDYLKQGKSYYTNRTAFPPPALYQSTSDIIDIVNLNVGWRWNNVEFGIFGDNLTNERGFMDPTSIEGRAAQPRPRTYGVSFGASF